MGYLISLHPSSMERSPSQLIKVFITLDHASLNIKVKHNICELGAKLFNTKLSTKFHSHHNHCNLRTTDTKNEGGLLKEPLEDVLED